MAYKVITAAATEPVSLADAKLHLRVDHADEDVMIESLITAAREFAEHYTGRALATQTLEMALDSFPGSSGEIELEMPPVATVSSVKYTDTAGVEQTLESSKYALKARSQTPREVALTYGNTWPSTQEVPEAVRIQYVTGYTACPAAVKSAILIHVQLSYDALTPQEREALETARDSLLDTVKVWGI